MRFSSIPGAAVLVALACVPAGAQPAPDDSTPPPIRREFRAAWVATVNNIDWPSRPGLSTWEQQQELLAILNKAVALRLNAIVFHVRPAADAFYASRYEPWSRFLTGRQGRPPEPQWDPLTFAIEQAHARGLELHAWFNPYRAHYLRDTAAPATTSIIRTQPRQVTPYAEFMWMDPGQPEVRARAIRVLLDVVRRYDVDGVHIDDYFYPYPVRDSSGRIVDFPDSASYARYVRGGGKLSRADWRRRNVDLLVESFYRNVKSVKPWVKVGVSPFGIWRPGTPEGITGFDAYEAIYADARKWWVNGWLDYLAPQLYWPIDRPQQSYPVLLDWWAKENAKKRHLWVGNFTGRVGSRDSAQRWPAQEIVRQVEATRANAGATGNIHFPMNVFMRNPDSVAERIAQLYAEPALIPASPWLDSRPPARPRAVVSTDAVTGDLVLRLTPAPKGERVFVWAVQTLADSGWVTEVLPARQTRHVLVPGTRRVVVSAVDRVGNASARVVVRVRARTRPEE